MTDGTETITTLHFALMAILAVLVVIAIVAGMRRKRARVQAHRDVLAHAEEAGVQPAPEAPAASERVASPAPTPSSPPPADAGDPATAPATRPATSRALPDEPIAAALGVEGTPVTIAVDAGAVDAGAVDAGAVDADRLAAGADAGRSPADGPLTQLKGLGPKVAARLGELGIDRVGQIAALDDAEAAALDAELGPFAGRMARDRWIEQARLLAAGDREGFERAFGKL